jgi:hypothetical protein
VWFVSHPAIAICFAVRGMDERSLNDAVTFFFGFSQEKAN